MLTTFLRSSQKVISPRQQRGRANRSRPVLVGFSCWLLAMSLHPQPSIAQGTSATQATVVEILDGNQVFIQNRQAKVNDIARLGQRIRTQDSRVELHFGNGAVGRLGKHSVLTVGDRCAQLRQGRILVNGTMNGCSTSVVAGVRGTIYLLEVDEFNQTEIKVLEGTVTVSQEQVMIPEEEPGTEPTGTTQSVAPLPPDLNTWLGRSPNVTHPNSLPLGRFKNLKQFGLPQPPKPSSGTPINQPPPSNSSPATNPPAPETPPPQPPTHQTGESSQEKVVNAGEKLAVGPSQGFLGPVEKLSQEEFSAILAGQLFTGFSLPLPGVDLLQKSFQDLFPGVPFPVRLPGLNLPGIPKPSLPGIPFF